MADRAHFPPAPEGWADAEIVLTDDNRIVLRAKDGAELLLDEAGMEWWRRPAQEVRPCS